MKSLCIIIFITVCFSMIGCSSLTQIVQTNFMAPPETTLSGNVIPSKQLGSLQVYDSNPYTVHLEIEERDTNEKLEQLNGDGGASLNAYAACLTLKVIF